MQHEVRVFRSRFPRQDQPSSRSLLLPMRAERGFLLLSTSGHRTTRAREVTFGRTARASSPVAGRLQGATWTTSGTLCVLVEEVLYALRDDLSWSDGTPFPGSTTLVAAGANVLVGRPTVTRTLEVDPQTMQTVGEFSSPIPDLVLHDGRWLAAAAGTLGAVRGESAAKALQLPPMRGAVATGSIIAAASLPRVDRRTAVAPASAPLLWIDAADGEIREHAATADRVLGFEASGRAVAVTLDPALREFPRVVHYDGGAEVRSAAMRKSAMWWGLHPDGVIVGFDESSQKTDRMVVVQWTGEALGDPQVADARITPEKKA